MKKLKPLLCWAALAASVQATPIVVQVDARQAPRRLLRCTETIPVTPGPLTLVYAKWIPGEHGPTGPIDNVVDLQLSAGGQPVRWQRDPLDMVRFQVEVPAGVTSLQASLAFVGGFGSEKLGVISWNELLLFPAGTPADSIPVQASVQLPAGWSAVGALQRTPVQGQFQLPEASLASMIDSPVLMGQHLVHLDLHPRAAAGLPALPHGLHLAAERPEALKDPDKLAQQCTRLVEEAGAIFGARHYAHYDWLVSLSEVPRGFGGLEHHECSDNVMGEDTLLEEHPRQSLVGLLAHEYAHSWNGKYRRPAGLLSPDYQQKMDGSLLWVYEGLTTYLGEVLPTRAGAVEQERCREELALLAASYEHEAGKRWRSLADTATAAQLLYQSGRGWNALRRSVDFYGESVLLWLEVDARMRELSHDKVSLDDFMRAFYGGDSGRPSVKPYSEEDLYATLHSLVPHDWKKEIRARLDATDGKYFAEALRLSGWQLVYDDKENEVLQERDSRSRARSWMFSVGLTLESSGAIRDVDELGPAGLAGLAPGMNVVAVNSRKYSAKGLDEAVAGAAKRKLEPIRLLVENGGYYREYSLDWHGGPHFPHLERLKDRPDRLSQILAPRFPPKS